MTREIKFRVWDKSKRKMSEVGCIEFVDRIEGRTGVNAFTYENQIRKDRWIEDKDAVLMQFTGLKDKNGKEIYESDCDDVGNVVEWCNGGWTLNGDRPLSMMVKTFEVKGNIYENR